MQFVNYTRRSHMSTSHGSRRISRRNMLQFMGYGATAAYLAACAPAATPVPTAAPTSAPATTSPPTTAPTASTEDVNGLKLADFSKANIDWQKFKGVSLGVAMLQSAP